MARNRVKITIDVEVDLDDLLGPFHTRESAKEIVANILADTLNTRIPQYRPVVWTKDEE